MFLSVAYVLSSGRRAEIGLAIVKTVVIDMIDKHTIGNFAHLTMHIELTFFAVFGGNPANRVECRAAFDGVPFALGKPKIIIRIDDGELTLSKRYPAEGVAVANSPI